MPYDIHFFIDKQPVYNQLQQDLQKVKQLLGLKHVTISNFANKIFAYVNIATTLHNHMLYTANVNQYIVQNALFNSMLHLGIEHFNLVNRLKAPPILVNFLSTTFYDLKVTFGYIGEIPENIMSKYTQGV